MPPARIAALAVLSAASLAMGDEPTPLTHADIVGVVAPIRSIDPTEDDFADLAPIGRAIGAARIVWLGEQSHGEGSVFLAKARLIEYLHRELGFDVLVWESGLASGPAIQQALEDPAIGAVEAHERGVFPIWTRARQVHPALEYVKSTRGTDRPIATACMDAQITGRREDRNTEGAVRRAYETLGWVPADALAWADPYEEYLDLRDIERGRAAAERMRAAAARIRQDAARIADAGGSSIDAAFAVRALTDGAYFISVMAAMDEARVFGERVDPSVYVERDVRMGDNLVWLADEAYPGRKIIVWAATMHGVRNVSSIVFPPMPGNYDDVTCAGQGVWDAVGEDLYHIAFTTIGGEARNAFGRGQGDVGPPGEGSLEAALRDGGHRFAFVDLRGLPEGHALRGRFWARPLGNGTMHAPWRGCVDAFFAIDGVFGASDAHVAPEGAVLTDPDWND